MTEPATHSIEGPHRGHLPVVTMVGALLAFFLFVLLVWVMWYFVNQKYTPHDDSVERIKQRTETQSADQNTLSTFGKTDTGKYRIPINRAMQLIIDESEAKAKAPSKGKDSDK